MLTSIHILQTLCALERRGGAGVGREDGEGQEGKGGEEGHRRGEGEAWEEEGVGEGRQKNKGVILSSDMVNLQEATALGHMQGC